MTCTAHGLGLRTVALAILADLSGDPSITRCDRISLSHRASGAAAQMHVQETAQ